MKLIKKDRLAIWASKMIAKAQSALHVSPEALVTLDIDFVDKDGNIYKRIEGKSHSLVHNYYSINAVTSQLLPIVAPYTSGWGTSGNWEVNSTAPTLYYSVPFSHVGTASIGAASDATLGIVVGTGVAAESFYYNVALNTLCAQGSGVNQAQYSAQVKTCTWDSGLRTWTTSIIRKISNSSAADITVNEIGLIENVYIAAAGTIAKVLMVRDDVSASPITLPMNNGIIVTYGFTYQFP